MENGESACGIEAAPRRPLFGVICPLLNGNLRKQFRVQDLILVEMGLW